MKEQFTVFTVIFGTIEKPKEPLLITPGWKYKLFTDQEGFESKVWEIIKVPTPKDTRLEARKYKALFWEHIDTRFSMWTDASFTINTNLNWFWKNHFNKPFSAPFHPQRDCVYEEAKAIIEANRGGGAGIVEQIKSYEGVIPKHNGLIAAGIILREDNPRCRELCSAWYAETSKEGNSQRDQPSFAKVSMDYTDIISYFTYPYNRRSELIYNPHKNYIINGKEFM